MGGTVIESPLCPHTPHLTIESDASNIGWGVHQGDHTKRGGNPPYQLSVTASSLSCGTMFCKRTSPNNYSVEAGQYNCNDLHQQNGRYTVRVSESAGPLLMRVESGEGDILNSGASARERECSGRPGVQNNKGSL